MSARPNEERVSEFYHGGIAGSLAATCTHPLDLLKVQLQTQQASKVTLPQLVKTVFNTNGFFGFYNGLSASILRQMTYGMTRVAVYDSVKEKLGNRTLPFHQKALLAAGAGTLGGIVGQPADLVNVRMQNDMKLPADQRRNYKHAFDGLIRIQREEGVRFLFNGTSMTCLRAALVTIGQLGCYDQAKQILMTKFNAPDNVATHFSASVLAASAATLMTQPVDVMKTRMMNAEPGEFKGIMDCFFFTLKTGPRTFFKGLVPAFIRLAPHTVLMLVFLEQLRLRFGHFPADKN